MHQVVLTVGLRLLGAIVAANLLLLAVRVLARLDPLSNAFYFWLATAVFAAWLVVALLMILRAARVLTFLAPTAPHGAKHASHSLMLTGIRLVGLYFLAQAACDTVHMSVDLMAHLPRCWSVELRRALPGPELVGLSSIVAKTAIGLWFLLGPARVSELIGWARTAGRNH